MNKKKLKIILFALTGFGNAVLKRLISNKNVFVSSVITEKYDNPFPYYKETQLLEFCHTKKIPCYYDITIS
ncbi:hypothetical protein J7L67_05370, partial [bacterium]|nr:hypothetical protein [bacterium]